MFLYKLNKTTNMNAQNAFTLTEVLLAVGIVGIIAALVLPAVITSYQSTMLEKTYSRQVESMKSALQGLPVNENKANFGDTFMYKKASDDVSYEDSAGKFLKKYMRIARYCGDTDNNLDDIKSNCFAPEYSLYKRNDQNINVKEDYEPEYEGACAVLKNGAAVCIKPQVGGVAAQGYIDVNGPKGPNIYGRDLQEFSLGTITFRSFDTISKATTGVNTLDFENIEGDQESPCTVDDPSDDCCEYRANKGSVTDPEDVCCTNTIWAPKIAQCASEVALKLNLYPSSCKLKYASGGVSKCSETPYVQALSTTAKKESVTISSLPANPPMVYLFCDGKQAGYLSSANLKSAVEYTGSKKYPFTITTSENLTCGYQSGEGIKSSKASVVFTPSGNYKNYSYNNVKWSLTYF